MNGTTEPSKKIPGSSLTCMHQNARMGVCQKFRWREWHLAKVGVGALAASARTGSAVAVQRVARETPSSA